MRICECHSCDEIEVVISSHQSSYRLSTYILITEQYQVLLALTLFLAGTYALKLVLHSFLKVLMRIEPSVSALKLLVL